MSDTINEGGPAFPITAGNQVYAQGMRLRAYAAIHLQQPASGIDWLDDMIRSAKRDEIAGQALVGIISTDCSHAMNVNHRSELAYRIADAMIAVRND